ncbi:At2g23090 like [Carpediemonas membranifera]|uniref:At2g23090 like n=1 Tax=Carpediemonas membranifera TaxID=201153 RepID=A0A8J6BV54_9EUKA|nr:At2g23090 like [Carpediemonas membranifera]|eukprot:KAG9391071.1 At2g23090 like [Carpediemonas membranifera]
MGGKAKPTKHTAKEIASKTKAATTNRGGGAAGAADRKGGKAGHIKYQCYVCGQCAPDPTSMKNHFESKHPKLPYEPEKLVDKHEAAGGVTTTGVAIRGSKKKK